MIELRKNSRSNVIWRGAIKLGDEKIIPVKIVNISSAGILIQSPDSLDIYKDYSLMMEVPSIHQLSADRHHVPCKILVMHVRLSGDFYQIGARFSEISDLHRNLFDAWLSITTKFDQLI